MIRLHDYLLNELAECSELNFRDRSVYLWILIAAPRSVNNLSRKLGLTWTTTAKACRRLAAAEWLLLQKESNIICPIPLIPIRCQAKLAEMLEHDYGLAPHKGEFLMKRQLDLRIRSLRFFENARPKFLTNPMSNQQLEYDRYYLDGFAFEFNGTPHYTSAPGMATQEEIRTRDLLKVGLSKENGIELVVVTSKDLRPDKFVKLLPEGLQRNHVDEEGPYAKTLGRIGTHYADKALRGSR